MANYEQLFLLEVLVDKVKLLTRALEAFAPECEEEPDTPVRIRVKFSDFPCFEITQDLAPPAKEKKESDALCTPIVFSSGKSCMFPMDPEQLIQDLVKYPMAVTVFKKNPESPLPEIIGQTKVPLGDYMTNIIKRAAEWSLEEPLSEMVQDTFPLRNSQEQDVGTITMLIRLTCFGKTIITKFQIADNKKSFLFKNAKTQDYEFKCKKCMPGQPILRPQSTFAEEGEDEEEGDWDKGALGMDGGTSPLLCVEKEPPSQQYARPCFSNRPVTQESFLQQQQEQHPPGFQRHELQGPGFTASMEVTYPDDGQDSIGQSGNAGVTESQSTPTVKKESSGGKGPKRGKSVDAKKIDVENGVNLGTNKRKKKTKFHVPRGIAYPGVILGHKFCVAHGPPIPAKNGWAWKTTVPLGMKWEDVRGWKPGAYKKPAWAMIQAVEEARQMGKRRKGKRKPVLPDNRKTTVHIHRVKGIYHVTMNPVKGPEDKEDPEPIVYTLDQPEEGSDASELELDLTVPDPPYPPPPKLKHQAQQFCEEDLPPLIQQKPVFIKKKKKKKEKPPESTDKKKKPGSAKSKGSEKGGQKGTAAEKGGGKDGGKADQRGAKGGKDGGKPDQRGAKGGKEDGKKGVGGKDNSTGKDAKGGGKDAKGKDGKGGAAGKDAKGGAAGKDAKGGAAGKDARGGAAGGKDAKGGGKDAKGKDGKGGAVRDTKSIAATGKESKSSAGASKDSTKGKNKGKGKKKSEDEEDVYPWDEWIMKLKCKNKQSPDD